MASGWGLVGRRLLTAAVRAAPGVIGQVRRSRAAGARPAGRPSPATGALRVERTSPVRTSGGRHTDRRHPASDAPRDGARGARGGQGRPPRQRATAAAARSLSYAPDLDGDADPGEVVWTWVAYEEDPTRGKDRPVLVVGREGADVLALMLSSKDHDGDDDWLALGPGAWDREHRSSWLRLDRVLVVEDGHVRREGSVLARDRFDAVAARLRAEHGWR